MPYNNMTLTGSLLKKFLVVIWDRIGHLCLLLVVEGNIY